MIALPDRFALTFYERVYMPKRRVLAGCANDRQFRIQLRHFNRFLKRPATLDDFTDDHIEGLLWWLRSGLDGKRQREPETCNKAHAALCAIWRMAAQLRLVECWPTVRAMDEPAKVPISWREPELERLFSAIRAVSGDVAGIPARLWWEGLHRVWLNTGERTWATVPMLWSWLDLSEGWLIVPASTRKGKKKPAVYKLKPTTVDFLRLIQRHPAADRERVFPWPYSRAKFYLDYRALLKSADLPFGRHDKPQKLRRTFASWVERNGGNATEALQHSSRATTERSYLDPTVTGRADFSQYAPEPPQAAG